MGTKPPAECKGKATKHSGAIEICSCCKRKGSVGSGGTRQKTGSPLPSHPLQPGWPGSENTPAPPQTPAKPLDFAFLQQCIRQDRPASRQHQPNYSSCCLERQNEQAVAPPCKHSGITVEMPRQIPAVPGKGPNRGCGSLCLFPDVIFHVAGAQMEAAPACAFLAAECAQRPVPRANVAVSAASEQHRAPVCRATISPAPCAAKCCPGGRQLYKN